MPMLYSIRGHWIPATVTQTLSPLYPVKARKLSHTALNEGMTDMDLLWLRVSQICRLQFPRFPLKLIFPLANLSSLAALHTILLFPPPPAVLQTAHCVSTRTELPSPWLPPFRCLGQSEGFFPQIPRSIHPEGSTFQVCPHLNLSSRHLGCLGTGLLSGAIMSP